MSQFNIFEMDKRQRMADSDNESDDNPPAANNPPSSFEPITLTELADTQKVIPMTSSQEESCWGCDYGFTRPKSKGCDPILRQLWEVWEETADFPIHVRCEEISKKFEELYIEPMLKKGKIPLVEPWMPEKVQYHMVNCLRLEDIKHIKSLQYIETIEETLSKIIFQKDESQNIILNTKELDAFHKNLRHKLEILKILKKE